MIATCKNQCTVKRHMTSADLTGIIDQNLIAVFINITVIMANIMSLELLQDVLSTAEEI